MPRSPRLSRRIEGMDQRPYGPRVWDTVQRHVSQLPRNWKAPCFSRRLGVWNADYFHAKHITRPLGFVGRTAAARKFQHDLAYHVIVRAILQAFGVYCRCYQLRAAWKVTTVTGTTITATFYMPPTRTRARITAEGFGSCSNPTRARWA